MGENVMRRTIKFTFSLLLCLSIIACSAAPNKSSAKCMAKTDTVYTTKHHLDDDFDSECSKEIASGPKPKSTANSFTDNLFLNAIVSFLDNLSH